MPPRQPKGCGPQRGARGFTLLELMTVVVIIGVLSTLAIYSVRKYILSAKASEAGTVLNAIRAAEEIYRQDTFVYLDVSEGDFGNLHPTNSPDGAKRNWAGGTTTTAQKFRELGVSLSEPVAFSYGVVAGVAGASFPTPPTTKTDFNFPSPATEPFYIAVAKGNFDGDSEFSWALTHSLTDEIYVEREGE